jgi:hypothetical protein
MLKKFALSAMAVLFVAGLCLAANSSTAASNDSKPWQSRLRTPPAATKAPYVQPPRYNPKVWHVTEGFEGSWLPAGWTTQNLAGSYVWEQSTNSVHTGSYSAHINYDCGTTSDERPVQ